jgi:adenosylcobinamide kinase/adenosylcobinamide-phosphate guanylyltransferase
MRHEFILGGQRSGKSRCAELRAGAWLGQAGHSAVLIATAFAGDDEMRARIARHKADRSERVPCVACAEVPLELPQALRQHSTARQLVVIDCLTLWLTNLLMPMQGKAIGDAELGVVCSDLVDALQTTPGPVVIVSNEIGLGLAPMTGAARHFVDALGRLHQRVAAVCDRVTLMVAGIEVPVKGGRS